MFSGAAAQNPFKIDKAKTYETAAQTEHSNSLNILFISSSYNDNLTIHMMRTLTDAFKSHRSIFPQNVLHHFHQHASLYKKQLYTRLR